MPYNPYDYRRYLDVLNSRRALTTRAGMSFEEHLRSTELKRQAAEIAQREIFSDFHGGIHRTREGMWRANAQIEDREGHGWCQNKLNDLD